MSAKRSRAFTLLEVLISVAILSIMLTMIFRPLMLGFEILTKGTSERQAQSTAQDVVDRLTNELRGAVAVYSNLGTFDLRTGAAAGGMWRTAQPERISFVPAAMDANGRPRTPMQPATDAAGRPQVVTYWVMRSDLTQPYDPLHNPRRVYRAVSYYTPFVDPANGLAVVSPDDVYRYAVQQARLSGTSLNGMGPTVFSNLFATGQALDFYVANVDGSFLGGPPASPAEQLMRSPWPQAQGAPDPFTHASAMLGLSTVTDAGTDVREASLLPYRVDQEQLAPNRHFSAYRGSLARWIEPYQRNSDGLWTAPSAGVIQTSTGPKPLLGMFRVQTERDGPGGPLELNYFLSVDQDPSSPTVGHVLLYRAPISAGGDAIPVYDVADYPRRIFGTTPGAMPASPAELSGEMAVGINWQTGELLTSFPQEDVICPAGDGNGAVVLALNNYNHSGPKPPAPYFGGSPGPAEVWQALPLTSAGNPAGNGEIVDQHMVSGGQHQWSSYTLSVFRPERLRTGGLAIPLDKKQLNMSIVPGSLRVAVEKIPAGAGGGAPLATRSYQVVDSQVAGAAPALQPWQCYADPASGRLTFYDPQLAGDALSAHDGYNPPLDSATETINGIPVRTIIRVNYEYRNNLPTVAQMLAGRDGNRDVVEMTYRSLQSIVLNLTLDVAANSTRGATEVIGDPADGGAPTSERPTGARQRVTVQQRLTVGAR